jgi:hypothetical protein
MQYKTANAIQAAIPFGQKTRVKIGSQNHGEQRISKGIVHGVPPSAMLSEITAFILPHLESKRNHFFAKVMKKIQEIFPVFSKKHCNLPEEGL